MAWVYRIHRWLGLLSGWLLLVICITGTLVVYKHPLKVWANPRLVSAPSPEAGAGLTPDEALARFRQAYPHTPRLLAFPSDRYSIHSYSYALTGEAEVLGGRAWLHPGTGQMQLGLQSDFADFVQRLHAGLWMGSQGRWVVGALGVLMALSLLSGLVLHWRRLGRDLFHLRVGSAPRKAWGDVHKFSAVWLFAFHLVIAVTGAWLGVESLIGLRNPPPHSSAGQAATVPMARIDQLLANATAAVPDLQPTHLNFTAYGREGSTVRVQGTLPGLELVQRGQTMVVMDARTAEVLDVVDRRTQGALAHALAMVRPLHYGYFGGAWMELAYFLMGAVCSALVFSGLAVWCSRESDATQRRAGGQAVAAPWMARVNLGVTQGLLLSLLVAAAATHWHAAREPVADGVLMHWGRFAGAHSVWSNAALAPELAAFLLLWLGMAAVLAWGRNTRRMWQRSWVAAAGLLAMVPVLSALGAGSWQADWQRGQGEAGAIALGCWAAALCCSGGAWLLRGPRTKNFNEKEKS